MAISELFAQTQGSDYWQLIPNLWLPEWNTYAHMRIQISAHERSKWGLFTYRYLAWEPLETALETIMHPKRNFGSKKSLNVVTFKWRKAIRKSKFSVPVRFAAQQLIDTTLLSEHVQRFFSPDQDESHILRTKQRSKSATEAQVKSLPWENSDAAPCERAARLSTVDLASFAFGADVCHSFLRRRGLQQMRQMQSEVCNSYAKTILT